MREVLSYPMLRRLWYAQIVSVFGDLLALFAVIGVLTFNQHATAQQVTGVQIAYMLPIAILGVLAGVFVDRWPPQAHHGFALCAVLVLLVAAAGKLWMQPKPTEAVA